MCWQNQPVFIRGFERTGAGSARQILWVIVAEGVERSVPAAEVTPWADELAQTCEGQLS